MKRYQIKDKVTLDFANLLPDGSTEPYTLILTPAYSTICLESDEHLVEMVSLQQYGSEVIERHESMTLPETLGEWVRDGLVEEIPIPREPGLLDTETGQAFFRGFACGCVFVMLIAEIADMIR